MHHHHSLLSLQVGQPCSDISTTNEFTECARIRGRKRITYSRKWILLFLSWYFATNKSKPSYSQWAESASCPGLPPVAGDANVCHMSSGTGGQIPASPDQDADSTVIPQGEDKQWCGCFKIYFFFKNQSLFKKVRTQERLRTEGWGLRDGQNRWSPPAPVIGLPRLSARGDQSHRSCLLPDQISSRLMCLS